MKNTNRIKVWSFATAKLQAKIIISLLIMILVVIGFSIAACDDTKSGDGDGSNLGGFPGSGDPGGGTGGGGSSSNGWTTVDVNSIFGSELNYIAFGNNKFVAGGRDGDGYGVIADSPDGVTWTKVNVSDIFNTINSAVNAIAYGNGTWVAVGMEGYAAYSTDGKSWKKVTTTAFDYTYNGMNGKATFYSIAYGNGKFVAVGSGYDKKLAYSTDGANWQSVDVRKIIDSNILSIVYGNNMFVAGSFDGAMATSSDGVTWTKVTDSKFGKSNIDAIVCGNGKFVATGGITNKMAYSTDGTNWTAVNVDSIFVGTGTYYIRAVAYGNGKFIAGSDHGIMATSTDGANWTAIDVSIFPDIETIAYGNGTWVVGGEDVKANNKIAYSKGN